MEYSGYNTRVVLEYLEAQYGAKHKVVLSPMCSAHALEAKSLDEVFVFLDKNNIVRIETGAKGYRTLWHHLEPWAERHRLNFMLGVFIEGKEPIEDVREYIAGHLFQYDLYNSEIGG